MPIPDDPVDNALAKDKAAAEVAAEPGYQKTDRGANNRTGIAAKTWAGKIAASDKMSRDWEDDYQCDYLQEFFAGHQWANPKDAENKYTGNRFFSSILAHRPSLFFQRPKFKINPLPPFGDDPESEIEARFQLLEDTTNTVIANRKVRFKESADLGLMDAYFRFGILMGVWDSNYQVNPNAGKPIQLEDQDSDQARKPEDEQSLKPLKQPKVLPEYERVYVKHISAKRFRIGIEDRPILEENEWCGYCEWVTLKDVKANKSYNDVARRNIKSSGEWNYGNDNVYSTRPGKLDVSNESGSATVDTEESELYREGMVLLWHIYHMRSMSYFVMAEGYKGFVMNPEEYEIFPFSDLRFAEYPDSWLPIPITYPWLSPQQERNEVMSDIRTHRKRFKRRILHDPSKVKSTEMAKLESAEDGVYAEVEAGVDPSSAYHVVPDAGLDPNISNTWLEQVNRDFDQVAGIGADQRGASSSGTATAAAITDARAQVRESYARAQVADWLARTATIIMKMLCRYATAPVWVKLNVDRQSKETAKEVGRVIGLWHEIKMTGDDADGFDELNYEIETDIASMAPQTQDAEKADWFQVLGLITNPSMLTVLAASPYILKKTFGYFNITNSRTIQELQSAMERAIQIQQAIAEQAAAKAAGVQGGMGPSGTPAANAAPGSVSPSSDQQARILEGISSSAAGQTGAES